MIFDTQVVRGQGTGLSKRKTQEQLAFRGAIRKVNIKPCVRHPIGVASKRIGLFMF